MLRHFFYFIKVPVKAGFKPVCIIYLFRLDDAEQFFAYTNRMDVQ